jgi:hypothetical protein
MGDTSGFVRHAKATGRTSASLDALRYFTVAVWNSSHWSARGVHVNRSRVA